MYYYVKNESGNVSDVTEEIYNRLKNNDSYECWKEDPYKDLPEEVTEMVDEGVPYKGKSSTDYTIAELKEMRDDFSDENWEEFIEGDERKTVPD